MATGLRNDELLDMLQGEYQRRYEPNFSLTESMGAFLGLTGLRGFWPMASADSAGATFDLSGLGKSLTYNGNPLYEYAGLAPYIKLDGTGDYLDRPDEADLDILGTEAYISSPGLTFGGWFYRGAAGVAQGLIGKYNIAFVNQRSYLLTYSAANTLQLLISGDGTTVIFITSSVGPTLNTWHFLVGRFTPSTELSVWLDSTKTTNVVSIPASLYNSTADLNIGAYSNGTQGRLAGRASLCFLCASSLSDTHIFNMYQRTRALFGK